MCPPFVFSINGYCPLCEGDSTFKAERDRQIDQQWHPHWFRNSLLCIRCGSIPRERALFEVLKDFYPNWRELSIHESSPAVRGVSQKFRKECPSYISTHYYMSTPFGTVNHETGIRSENLEEQTFPSECFDLVVALDVFEHLFHPAQAIREIERTLKPGGAFIMSVPIVKYEAPSERRAAIHGALIEYILEPQYHGNPADCNGSLVTIDWGFDIVEYLSAHTNLYVYMFCIDRISHGIQDPYNRIIICKKSSLKSPLLEL